MHSSNVLLDKNYVAKLSDFGLALDLPNVPENKTLVTAPLIARTEGYFPPELTSGKFSQKSDVFSYGVVSNKCIMFYYLLVRLFWRHLVD